MSEVQDKADSVVGSIASQLCLLSEHIRRFNTLINELRTVKSHLNHQIHGTCEEGSSKDSDKMPSGVSLTTSNKILNGQLEDLHSIITGLTEYVGNLNSEAAEGGVEEETTYG